MPTDDTYDDVHRPEEVWKCGRCGAENEVDISDTVCSFCAWTGGTLSDKVPKGLHVNVRKIVTQS